MTLPDLNLASINKRLDDTLEALAKSDAELKWELAGSAADIAGLADPTPTSDLIGAGLALRSGDFVGAALSTVSMVPYIGDAMAKPVKAVRASKKIIALEQKVAKLTKEANDLKKLKKEAEAAETAAAKETKAVPSTTKAEDAAVQQEKAATKTGKDCEDCSAASKPKKLPETKVPCFHPFDKKKFVALSKADQKKYLQEMHKQLTRQSDGINKLTAREFDAARQAYNASKRNPLAAPAQKEARKAFQEKLESNLRNSMLDTMGPAEAKARAKEKAAELMTKLAALHDPDMVAGGHGSPRTEKMGRSDVNSSIGASWNQDDRVKAMDTAAQRAIAEGRGDEKMNVKLTVCRGKDIR